MNDADVLRAAAAVINDHSMQRGPTQQKLLDIAARIEKDAKDHDEPVPFTAGLFTRQEAEAPRRYAAELLAAELGLSERDTDLLTLAGAVAAEAIDNPAVTLDEVIAAQYDQTPAEVRSWWTAWS